MNRYILIFFIFISPVASAQDMYKALQSEHGKMRFGIGAQLLEPTGITVQAFHGFFCSNSDSYATYGVLELGLGVENTVFTTENTAYKTGTWKSGGFRAELNYLYPMITLEPPAFAFQFYLGTGLQTGGRKYGTAAFTDQATATGVNFLARAEVIGHGKESGRSILFFSFYVDAKYHRDFGEDFNYFKPSFGIRVRKGR